MVSCAQAKIRGTRTRPTKLPGTRPGNGSRICLKRFDQAGRETGDWPERRFAKPLIKLCRRQLIRWTIGVVQEFVRAVIVCKPFGFCVPFEVGFCLERDVCQ